MFYTRSPYFSRSLSLNSRNCGTWGYIGQMYALQQDQLGGAMCMDALCSLQAQAACAQSAVGFAPATRSC